MTNPNPDDANREDRSLGSVIASYLRDARGDRKADRAEYLARFPELAAELESFFDEYDSFDRVALPLRDLGREIQVRPSDGAETIHPVRPRPFVIATPRDFGDFELGRVLGSGGMGVVYEARQRSINRLVALKMIHGGEWATAADVQRFRNEVESIARLAHPNIVPIFEVGETQGHHYYSMPLMGGGSLAGRLDTLKHDPKAAARLMIEIARAVDYAHRRGIIHRDLKPSNVLLDDAGRPHVSDFGLARRIGEDSSLTATGAILGSPPYMAPEQAAGRSREVTTATDVYGLGAILYAMLLGRPPFQGSSPLDLLEKVRQREPDRPRSIDRRVDVDLETICLECLEKEPNRRYAGAAALADDLGRWLDGRTILARRSGPARRLAKWSRRQPVGALLVVAAAVGIPAAFWLTLAAYRSSERQRHALDRGLYEARIALAELELSGGHPDRAEELLEECPPPLRGWDWNYLKRRQIVDPVFLATPGQVPVAVAFSPDGAWLASGHRRGLVRISEAATGREVRRLETGGHDPTRLSFSPDGRRLACSSVEGGVWVWELPEGRSLWSQSAGDGCWSVSFSPDGRQVAAAGFDRIARLFDADSGRIVREFAGHRDRVTGVSFRPDGLALASSGDDGSIRIWDPKDGALIREIPEGARFPIRDLAYAPDGSLLVAATSAGAIVAWDPATGREVFRRERHIRDILDLAFSPDGRLIATAGLDSLVRVWAPADGREVMTLRGHENEVWGVAFSPDGLRLASAGFDGAVRVWDARPWDDRGDGRARFFGKAAGRVEDVAFSPDGLRLASAGQDRAVTLWDLASARPLRVFSGLDGGLTCLAFDPNGRSIATGGYDNLVHLFNLEGAGKPRVLSAHTKTVLCVAYQPGGRVLATGGMDRVVRFWDADSGAELGSQPVENGWVNDLAFTPDGKQVAAGTVNFIALLDVASGKATRQLPFAGRRINALAFSPDGSHLAAAGVASEIFIMETEHWTIDRRVVVEDREVNDLQFTPDGRHLASIGSNHRIDFWDLADDGSSTASANALPRPIGCRSARTGADSRRPAATGRSGSGTSGSARSRRSRSQTHPLGGDRPRPMASGPSRR